MHLYANCVSVQEALEKVYGIPEEHLLTDNDSER